MSFGKDEDALSAILGIGDPGGKFALAKLGLSVASATVAGVSARRTAKANIAIEKRRAENRLRDFDFNSRAIEGIQLAQAGASGMNIGTFQQVFNSQAIEDSRKRGELIFENAIAITEFENQKRASLIKPAFKVGTSLLDFKTGVDRRKERASKKSLLKT